MLADDLLPSYDVSDAVAHVLVNGLLEVAREIADR
jgi:hypothetical protein